MLESDPRQSELPAPTLLGSYPIHTAQVVLVEIILRQTQDVTCLCNTHNSIFRSF